MLGDYTFWNVFVFIIFVVGALTLDLFAHKKNKNISIANATFWSIFWIGLAFIFSCYLAISHGKYESMLFLTGYFLEKSLSVDNLFVFIAVFSSFSIHSQFQHRILYYGIIGAIVMRMLFITIGSSFIAILGEWALLIFGFFVLWSAWKMWQHSKREKQYIEDYSNHWSVRSMRSFFPIHPKIEGNSFFYRYEGTLCVTPLFLCLVVIEVADIMFAFDSVSAIFSMFAGLPKPIPLGNQIFLIYTSNIFAILGLRSLYFLLAAANRHLIYLERAVIAILLFIGLKMLLGVTGLIHISVGLNLAIILCLLSLGIICSVFTSQKKV